jgi:putative transposase
VIARRTWIERTGELAVSRQCALAGVARFWVYGPRAAQPLDEQDLRLLELIDSEYTRRPFYGSRSMVIYLKDQGYEANRKRVQRLLRVLGLAGMAPGPDTSHPHPEHKIYSYLLRGVAVVRPNQVWSSDITYIRLEHGFAYLVAVIDWYARRVLAWRISNTLEAGFCVDCVEEALRAHGRPEVFNTDQGSQYTSNAFTGVLVREGIAISMDGRGRALDNVFVERLWRSGRRIRRQIGAFIQRHANETETCVGGEIRLGFGDDEPPQRSTCRGESENASRVTPISLFCKATPASWLHLNHGSKHHSDLSHAAAQTRGPLRGHRRPRTLGDVTARNNPALPGLRFPQAEAAARSEFGLH